MKILIVKKERARDVKAFGGNAISGCLKVVNPIK